MLTVNPDSTRGLFFGDRLRTRYDPGDVRVFPFGRTFPIVATLLLGPALLATGELLPLFLLARQLFSALQSS